MKSKNVLLASLLALSLLACLAGYDDEVFIEPLPSSQYTPVIMERSEFEASTIFESPKSIVNSGKIYLKDNFLFINEKNEGFHVFDNSNPENPINLGFIKVLGSSDLAIKGDILYVNNATDLIAIQPNIETSTVTITKRISNTFPQLFSPDGFEYYNLEENEIIINWVLNDE
ncbi:hypothetical protein [Mangrovimonas xylaniphaga]|uniref:hypothetical protein n=1 Tax=Mangrovimonas xylaniphaga TaxID=1645915 RepID=UPI0006B55408|nr:hypothetical protein [Mangrovimonas xylaniphaga]